MLFQTVAKRLIEIIQAKQDRANRDGAKQDGGRRVSIALGGGSTPRGLFDEWVRSHRDSIDWSRLLFFWGDERAVGPADPDSNFGMAQRHLLTPLGIADQQVFRLEGERTNLDEAARDNENALRRMLPMGDQGCPVLDLVLLGMGADAHTASLFPGTEALQERERWVVANPVPQLETTRLTMTYPLINAAEEVHFLVRGEAKAEALHLVLEGPRDPAQWPSQGIAAANVEWWVDRECTTQLQQTKIHAIAATPQDA